MRPPRLVISVSDPHQGGDPERVVDHNQRGDDERCDADHRPPFDLSRHRLTHCLFAGLSVETAGLYQEHHSHAEHHAGHEADQESEKEFSFHRGDHGEPDAFADHRQETGVFRAKKEPIPTRIESRSGARERPNTLATPGQ